MFWTQRNSSYPGEGAGVPRAILVSVSFPAQDLQLLSPVQLQACIAPWLTLFRLSISYLRSQDLAPSRTHEVAEIVLFILFPLPPGHTARFYYLAFFVRATRQKCVQEIVGRSDACPALTSPLNPPMTSSTLSGGNHLPQKQDSKGLKKERSARRKRPESWNDPVQQNLPFTHVL